MATEAERRVMLAIQDADRAFEKAGEGGTKNWLRNYFAPALREHKLRIVDENGTELAPAGAPGEAAAALFPTPEEVTRWVRDSISHAAHIEYYLERLQIGRSDIQRPHDLIGLGNKLEWPAIRGFAMQYRGPEMFEKYVRPALEYHRQQHHHLAWNEFNPTASPDAMRLGAVDAVCSLLEPRGYQGGCHTFKDIYGIAENNPIHEVSWMELVAMEMEKVAVKDTKVIFAELSNRVFALPGEKTDAILGRLEETRTMLRQDHGIELGAF